MFSVDGFLRCKCGKYLFAGHMGHHTQIVRIVVTQDDSLEEECHDATQLDRLGRRITQIAKTQQQTCFQIWITLQVGVLEQPAGHQSESDPHQNAAPRHTYETHDNFCVRDLSIGVFGIVKTKKGLEQ